jgi:hypothetical protein
VQHEGQDYKAFVLRLWRDGGARSAWRCSLEDPATHQRRGFEDVEALASYLRDVLAAKLDGEADDDQERKVTYTAGRPGAAGRARAVESDGRCVAGLGKYRSRGLLS